MPIRQFVRRIKNRFTGHEDRRTRRVRSFDLIKIRRADERTSFQITNVKDLSEGGLKLFVRERFASGDQVVLTVNFADHNDQISVEGLVKWSREVPSRHGFHVGVAYVGLNDRDRQLLKRLTTPGSNP